MMKKILLALLALFALTAQAQPRFSTAGFFPVEGSPRNVASVNPQWRLHVGEVQGGQLAATDDSKWQMVNLPNGIELLPYEASGGVNYRGPVWYRKQLALPPAMVDQRVVLYFEAIMGKSKIWVNDSLVATHFGGFTPIPIDITPYVKAEGKNLIAVWADNSDDPIYPPGKPQSVLDFCYFGGIYRDAWLVGTSKELYITDPNQVDKIAGGGLFASYEKVSEKSATINLQLDVASAKKRPSGSVRYQLYDPMGKLVAVDKQSIKAGENRSSITLQAPKLWSPEVPNLYFLVASLLDNKGNVVDAYGQRLGIKSIKFTGKEGLILNGKAYPRKLIGANRHQDFAVVGNALSNSLHYRDAAKLKAVGMEVIRNAHYPQDPAFMDACDELGLFVIVNTPGWQFWNDAPIFEERVYSDIRSMVRRDRNHASVLMWEPILNETHYPEAFAKNTHDLIKAEIPFSGSNYTAADMTARGSGFFDIIFTHPRQGIGHSEESITQMLDPNKVYFTREWGDNVDDWNAHNSPSRVSRAWGEVPQLIQAIHYAAPQYPYTCYETLQQQPAYHFGGTLWHSFDHQRGYHPDPFYGGIMDAFRRPKYSYELFRAQPEAPTAPMVFIANELTPFSPEDITVFSNCAKVRLTTFVGTDTVRTAERKAGERWFTFEKAWNQMADKALSRSGKQREAFIVAEGLDASGKVVATDRRMAARRPTRLELTVDTMDLGVVADGGDLVVVTARMVDRQGTIKRLNNNLVRFTVSGAGRMMADEATQTNPVPIAWGEASVLVRSTVTAGPIRVRASVLIEGDNTPLSAEVVFNSVEPSVPVLVDRKLRLLRGPGPVIPQNQGAKERAAVEQALREVEQQQTDFE